MATVSFDRVGKLFIVPDPEIVLTVQELYDQAQDWLDEPSQMTVAKNVEAAGKFDLGAGEFTAVSLKLLDGWRVKFADRASFVLCQVTGGNLIAVDTGGSPSDPIAESVNTFVVIRQSTAPAAIQTPIIQNDLDAIADAVWLEDSTQAFGADTMGDQVGGGGLVAEIFNKLFGPLFAK